MPKEFYFRLRQRQATDRIPRLFDQLAMSVCVIAPDHQKQPGTHDRLPQQLEPVAEFLGHPLRFALIQYHRIEAPGDEFSIVGTAEAHIASATQAKQCRRGETTTTQNTATSANACATAQFK